LINSTRIGFTVMKTKWFGNKCSTQHKTLWCYVAPAASYGGVENFVASY